MADAVRNDVWEANGRNASAHPGTGGVIRLQIVVNLGAVVLDTLNVGAPRCAACIVVRLAALTVTAAELTIIASMVAAAHWAAILARREQPGRARRASLIVVAPLNAAAISAGTLDRSALIARSTVRTIAPTDVHMRARFVPSISVALVTAWRVSYRAGLQGA